MHRLMEWFSLIYDLNGIKSITKRQLLPVGVNASPFQADYDHPAKLKNLVAESRNSAILDSRASNTITGKSWINTYIESLDDQDKAKIVFRDSSSDRKQTTYIEHWCSTKWYNIITFKEINENSQHDIKF